MSDLRSSLIRLASSMPPGSSEREKVLSLLREGSLDKDIERALQKASNVIVEELNLPKSEFRLVWKIVVSNLRQELTNLYRDRVAPVEAAHPLRLGDILVSAWGYDQTNIDFYEVVKVTFKSVSIRGLDKRTVRFDPPNKYVIPLPGRYKGPMKRKIPDSKGAIKISSYARAYPWDGTPQAETMSQYGH